MSVGASMLLLEIASRSFCRVCIKAEGSAVAIKSDAAEVATELLDVAELRPDCEVPPIDDPKFDVVPVPIVVSSVKGKLCIAGAGAESTKSSEVLCSLFCLDRQKIKYKATPRIVQTKIATNAAIPILADSTVFEMGSGAAVTEIVSDAPARAFVEDEPNRTERVAVVEILRAADIPSKDRSCCCGKE